MVRAKYLCLAGAIVGIFFSSVTMATPLPRLTGPRRLPQRHVAI